MGIALIWFTVFIFFCLFILFTIVWYVGRYGYVDIGGDSAMVYRSINRFRVANGLHKLEYRFMSASMKCDALMNTDIVDIDLYCFGEIVDISVEPIRNVMNKWEIDSRIRYMMLGEEFDWCDVSVKSVDGISYYYVEFDGFNNL